ncbi:MAG: aminoacyl-tRNA hydrolase [Planctomycetes bacterium]|nr:aminoacyl-tRNA hydrolase [Planctomycetota bacterium]
MKLVVGLGNPGRKYEATRHNVGFRTVDRLARRAGASVTREAYQGLMGECRLGSERVLLFKPMTFMNLSGQAVRAALDWYKEEPDQLLVVSDDFALPLARLRVRRQGSSGGHKGLASIAQHVGSDEFARIRVGIGQPPPRMDVVDFVLTSFSPAEEAELAPALDKAADAVECWATRGIEAAMNQFNAAPPPALDGGSE